MESTSSKAKAKLATLLRIELNEGLLTVCVSQQAKHVARCQVIQVAAVIN
jgi:hypothetical protein